MRRKAIMMLSLVSVWIFMTYTVNFHSTEKYHKKFIIHKRKGSLKFTTSDLAFFPVNGDPQSEPVAPSPSSASLRHLQQEQFKSHRGVPGAKTVNIKPGEQYYIHEEELVSSSPPIVAALPASKLPYIESTKARESPENIHAPKPSSASSVSSPSSSSPSLSSPQHQRGLTDAGTLRVHAKLWTGRQQFITAKPVSFEGELSENNISRTSDINGNVSSQIVSRQTSKDPYSITTGIDTMDQNNIRNGDLKAQKSQQKLQNGPQNNVDNKSSSIKRVSAPPPGKIIVSNFDNADLNKIKKTKVTVTNNGHIQGRDDVRIPKSGKAAIISEPSLQEKLDFIKHERSKLLQRELNLKIAEKAKAKVPVPPRYDDHLPLNLDNQLYGIRSGNQFRMDKPFFERMGDRAPQPSVNLNSNRAHQKKFYNTLKSRTNSFLDVKKEMGPPSLIEPPATYFIPRARSVNYFSYKKILSPDNLCAGNVEMVVIVITHPDAYTLRATLRKVTKDVFGKKAPFRLAFMLGRDTHEDGETSLWKAVQYESKTYNDVIAYDFLDTYRNLSVKSVMLLKWASQHCSNAKYLVKMDDDVYLDARNLLRILKTAYGSENFIGGYVTSEDIVHRDDEPKWDVTFEEYPYGIFPSFAHGPIYVMTMDIVRKLHEIAPFIPMIHLEDVFVTGILARAIGAFPSHMYGILIFPSDYEKEDVCSTIDSRLVAVHGLDSTQLATFYSAQCPADDAAVSSAASSQLQERQPKVQSQLNILREYRPRVQQTANSQFQLPQSHTLEKDASNFRETALLKVKRKMANLREASVGRKSWVHTRRPHRQHNQGSRRDTSRQ